MNRKKLKTMVLNIFALMFFVGVVWIKWRAVSTVEQTTTDIPRITEPAAKDWSVSAVLAPYSMVIVFQGRSELVHPGEVLPNDALLSAIRAHDFEYRHKNGTLAVQTFPWAVSAGTFKTPKTL